MFTAVKRRLTWGACALALAASASAAWAQTPEADAGPNETQPDPAVAPPSPAVAQPGPTPAVDATPTSGPAEAVPFADPSTKDLGPPPGVPGASADGLVASAGARGFAFSSADRRNSLALHLLIQGDYLTFLGPTPAGQSSRDTFLLGFAGLQLEATLDRIFGATLLVDFSQSRVTLINAFAEARLLPELVLRIGKFPTPINEERLTPKILLPWISVSPASFLLPVTELGLQLLGDLGKGVLQYNLALVNGSTAGPLTDNDPDTFKDLMGRLYAHPFRHTAIAPLADLGLGLGASFGRHEGTLAAPETPALRTYGNAPFFGYRNDGTPTGTVLANGDVARVVPHLTWSWGPLAAYGDYVHEVDGFGAASIQSNAWSASGIVALTGEDAHPFSRISVARPLDPMHGHFGGAELIVGGGQVLLANSAFSTSLATPTSIQTTSVIGAGLNWYPIDGVGLDVDGSHTTFEAHANAFARPAEDALYVQAELRL